MSSTEDGFDDDGFLVLSAGLAPITPARSLKSRLLAAVEARKSGGAFAGFVEPLARMFELSLEKARAILDATGSLECYEEGPHGIHLLHFNGGPRVAAFDSGIVRFPAGMEWGLHRHLGAEHHLFLEGGIRVHQDGKVYGPSDVLVMPPGSEHSFSVLPGCDCVTAVLLEGGIEMPPGVPLGV